MTSQIIDDQTRREHVCDAYLIAVVYPFHYCGCLNSAANYLL